MKTGRKTAAAHPAKTGLLIDEIVACRQCELTLLRNPQQLARAEDGNMVMGKPPERQGLQVFRPHLRIGWDLSQFSV